MKRQFRLVFLIGVLAVQALCVSVLALFTWRVELSDLAFDKDLRLQQHRSAHAFDAVREPAKALLAEFRVREGELAPDFSLRDSDGKETRLKYLLGQQPIVIEFGSLT